MGKNLKVGALLDVYGAFLSEKQRAITEYYYNDDLSLAEIAENEGITRQGVRDLIKRAEQQLWHYEEICGYCEKFSLLKKAGEDLKLQKPRSAEKIIDIIESL